VHDRLGDDGKKHEDEDRAQQHGAAPPAAEGAPVGAGARPGAVDCVPGSGARASSDSVTPACFDEPSEAMAVTVTIVAPFVSIDEAIDICAGSGVPAGIGTAVAIVRGSIVAP
jgi:hypothetical protein